MTENRPLLWEARRRSTRVQTCDSCGTLIPQYTTYHYFSGQGRDVTLEYSQCGDCANIVSKLKKKFIFTDQQPLPHTLRSWLKEHKEWAVESLSPEDLSRFELIEGEQYGG